MSKTIDNRVVSMEFDNSKFENRVKQSMNTLEKLKEKLDFSKSAKELQVFEKTANRVDLSGLASSIDSISHRFSALGIAGATIISNLTTSAMRTIGSITGKIKGLIVTGGVSRAMNIEKAKFQLEGLGVTWDSVFKDIDYAVTNTAYSLDAAALAASTLVASGVKIGDNIADDMRAMGYAGEIGAEGIDSMAVSLRAISGVAAQTNRDYSDVAHIFTTVAGQGRLMADQLNSLSSYGLNAAAKIGEVLGKSEAEIREMTSKGLIDYQTFASAMFTLFADHAVDANKTTTGVTANIRSAFARMGADFVQPIIKNEGPLVEMLEEVRKRVNYVKKALLDWKAGGMLDDKVVADTIEILHNITAVIKAFPIKNVVVIARAIGNVYMGLSNLARNMSPFFKTIKDDFREIFPKRSIDNVALFGEKARDALSSFKYIEKVLDPSKGIKTLRSGLQLVDDTLDTAEGFKSNKVLNNIARSLKGLFAAFSIVKQSAQMFLIPLKTLLKELIPIGVGFTGMTGNLGDKLAELNKKFEENQTFVKIGTKISEVISKIATVIRNAVHTIRESGFAEAIKKGLDTLTAPFDKLRETDDGLDKVEEKTSRLSKVGEVLTVIFGGISKVFQTVWPVLNALGTAVSKILTSVGIGVSNALSKMDLSKGGDLLGKGFLVALIVSVKRLVDSFKSTMFTFKKMFDITNVFGVLNQLKDSLFAWQRDLEWNKLVKLAGAVGILTLSILALSGIDAGEAAKGIAIVTSLLTVLVGAMAALHKFATSLKESPSKGIKGWFEPFAQAWSYKFQGDMILETAGAILILATAVIMLGKIKPEEAMQGVMALGAITGMLVILSTVFATMAKIMAKNKSTIAMQQFGTAILKISAGMLVLALAVKVLAKVSKDPKALWQGVSAVVALLTAFEIMMILNSKLNINTRSFKNIGKGIQSIAIGMLEMSAAVAIFGKMDPDVLIQGGIAMGIIIAALDAIAILNSKLHIKNNTIKKIGKGIQSIAIGMIEMALAISILGKLPIENLVKGGVAIGSIIVLLETLVLINSKLKVKDRSLKNLGKAMIAMGVGLIAIAAAVKILAGIKLTNLLKGLAAITVIFGLVMTLGILSKNVISPLSLIGVAAAMVIMAAALMVFVPPFILLASLPLEAIGKGLLVLAGAMVALAAGAAIGQFLGIGLAIFAAALVVLAASMWAVSAASIKFGLGLSLIATGLATLAQTAKLGITVGTLALIAGMAVGLLALTPILVVSSMALMMFGTALTTVATAFAILKPLLSADIDETTEKINNFSDGIKDILDNFLQNIIDLAPKFKDAAGEVIKNIALGYIENIPIITEAVSLTVISGVAGFLHGLAKALPTIIDSLFVLVEESLRGLADGIDKHARSLGEELGNALASVLTGAFDFALGVAIGNVKGFWGKVVKAIKGTDPFYEWEEAAKEHASSSEDTHKGGGGGFESTKKKPKVEVGDVTDFTSLGDSDASEYVSSFLKKVTGSDGLMGNGMDSLDFSKVYKQLGLDSGEDFTSSFLSSIDDPELQKLMKEAGIELGENGAEGVIEGLNKKKPNLRSTIKALMSDGENEAKLAWDIHSPSKKFFSIGKNGMLGLLNGISSMSSSVIDTISNVGVLSLDGMGTLLSNISSSVSDTLTIDPTITPILDLSEVTKGNSELASLLNSNSYTAQLSGAVSASMSGRQNRGNSDVISAINKLSDKLNGTTNNYTINGVTYDDGSNVASAVESLVRAAQIERRA